MHHRTRPLLLLSLPLPSDYLLSNNHINSMIAHKFDFDNEEVSGESCVCACVYACLRCKMIHVRDHK